MGLIEAPKNCYITGLKTLDHPGSRDSIDYSIDIEKIGQIHFSFNSRVDFKEIVEKNRHILKGLIYNKKWDHPLEIVINKKVIRSILDQKEYPKTAAEKRENLFLKITECQGYDGEVFHFLFQIPEMLYFQNSEELRFYLSSLENVGWIKIHANATQESYLSVTYEGLNAAIEFQESGQNSNKCFVAMSFDKEMDEIRNAIKNACIKTGFQPILVDDEHPDSDQTINDKIVAEIKKCKFLIADFTQQKDGVYFESGYAAGRGLNVIYTCREDDFKKSHFDTKHFSHIIYKTSEELTEKLINKIEAWIK